MKKVGKLSLLLLTYKLKEEVNQKEYRRTYNKRDVYYLNAYVVHQRVCKVAYVY